MLKLSSCLMIGFSAVFLFSCLSNKKSIGQNDYLPSIINNIQLGMTMKQTLESRVNAYVVNSLQPTPRHIYTEDIDSENFNSIYYFFSKGKQNKLVEINILHSSKDAAANTVKKYFGIKGSKQNQWHKILKNGKTIHATWRQQKVFIYINIDKENQRNVE